MLYLLLSDNYDLTTFHAQTTLWSHLMVTICHITAESIPYYC